MRKAIVWYGILLKENLMRKATWISLIAMLLLLVIVAQIRIPNTKNTIVGICTQQSDGTEALIEDLYAQQGAFTYRQYADREQLYEDIESGKLECGFILSPNWQRKLNAGDPEKCVSYVSSPYSTKGEVAKETFFASFLRVYSKQIMWQSEQDIFKEPDSGRMEEILKANARFMESDFFELEQVQVDAKSNRKEDGTCYPVQGLFGIFLLGFMYFANGRKFESGGRWISHFLSRKDVIQFSILQTLSAATLPAIAGILLILHMSVARQTPEELTRWLFLVIIGVPWIVEYSALARTKESFIAYGILLLVLCIMMYPVLVDLSTYIPAIKYLRYITPLGIWI